MSIPQLAHWFLAGGGEHRQAASDGGDSPASFFTSKLDCVRKLNTNKYSKKVGVFWGFVFFKDGFQKTLQQFYIVVGRHLCSSICEEKRGTISTKTLLHIILLNISLKKAITLL